MPRETALGELALVFSAMIFAGMAVLIKLVPPNFSGPFISTVRFALGIVFGLAYLKLTQTPFEVHQKLFLTLRGFFGSLAMGLYFTAIHMTGSGRATLLINTFPIFVALFGYLIFRETPSRMQLISVALGVIGVVLVFYDGSSYSVLGNLIGLASGVGRGMAVHFIKRSVARNHPTIVYLAACFWGMLLLPFTAHQMAQVTWQPAALLLLIGFSAFGGQMFMTYGMRYVSTIRASLLSYITIPLTVLLGALIGEELRGKFFLGTVCILSALVVNSGLFEKWAAISPRKPESIQE